jgi:hypothetical protein
MPPTKGSTPATKDAPQSEPAASPEEEVVQVSRAAMDELMARLAKLEGGDTNTAPVVYEGSGKGKTIQFRGKPAKIVRTTRNLITGAIVDHIEYDVERRDKHTGRVESTTMGRSLRRPGTGNAKQTDIEVETDVEVGADG